MRALIVVDVQKDFVPGGALAVPEGDTIIPTINALQKKFDLVIATKDWHPQNHGSFAANHSGKKVGDMVDLCGQQQILWPVHCIQNTEGAEFAATLATDSITKTFYKGTDPEIDSYSTFFDNAHQRSTGLGEFLNDNKVDQVYIVGLATDYCVKFSVLDSLVLGFSTFLVEDTCRGVNLNEQDSDEAIAIMHQAGAHIIQSSTV